MKATDFFMMLSFLFFQMISFGQTQAELGSGTLQKADAELNAVYNKVLKMYESDVAFIKNLKKSQRTWIKFRDAEMNAKYPKRKAGHYGSMQPLCWTNYKAKLINKRKDELKVWLDGSEEGDTCAGSVRIK